VLRDQIVAGGLTPGGDVPAWDLTLNNIPIAYPALAPAIMRMRAGERQLWRFTNSSADSLVDLQVLSMAFRRPAIVALDGVSTDRRTVHGRKHYSGQTHPRPDGRTCGVHRSGAAFHVKNAHL